MKINVKSLQGEEYIVDIENSHLVSELKACISEKANGLGVTRQKLVFKGRTMQDTSLVGEYNLEEGCKVHLIVQKEQDIVHQGGAATTSDSKSTFASTTDSTNTAATTNTTTSTASSNEASANKQSRFEVILRERLAMHFSPDAVEKIMVNLHHEINADIHSSSLDDLERLAKQKLNISNE